MTAKRWILLGLTLIVANLMLVLLFGSFNRPQVKSQLELYQTNLLLEATRWQDTDTPTDTQGPGLQTLLGKQPLEDALKKYQEASTALQTLQTTLHLKFRFMPTEAETNPEPEFTQTLGKLQTRLQALQLRQGLLEVATGDIPAGVSRWQTIAQSTPTTSAPDLATTASVLVGLWSEPPQFFADAPSLLTNNLSGWFQFQSLQRLYQLQQQNQDLAALQQQEQQAAETSIFKLLLLSGVPSLGGLVGIGILLTWVGSQILRFFRQRQLPVTTIDNNPETLVPTSPAPVPWGADVVWQVMVFWFAAFLGLSFTFKPLLQQLGIRPGNTALDQALFSLLSYSTLMLVGLSIIYVSIKPFVPNPLRWLPLKLKGTWALWSIGGYLAALPLVVIVSLLSQKIFHEQGGSNPILEIILNNQNRITIVILYLMVAVLAPIFEETLFRGFFLTSLTRYLPGWAAILCSGGLFAFAHLTASDLLPLTLLGMMLGYVYLRTENLLTSILLHSLWNSGSFLGLLVLASAPK